MLTAPEERGTAAAVVAQGASVATQANVPSQETGSSEPSRAWKGEVNVTVKHSTVVPQGRDKTDTISSMTLVYDL